jgi:hypothetical protein
MKGVRSTLLFGMVGLCLHTSALAQPSNSMVSKGLQGCPDQGGPVACDAAPKGSSDLGIRYYSRV